MTFYRAALDLAGSRKGAWRMQIAVEAADACARSGQHRGGAEILGGVLVGLKESRESGRLQGRLGILHHRAGEVTQAISHLEKGLFLLRGGEGLPWVRELLRIECELAETWSNRGDYPRAEAIARGALERLAVRKDGGRDPELRRGAMLLLETLSEVRKLLHRARGGGFFSPSQLRSRPLDQLHAQLEREYLIQLHADHSGNVRAMAAALGISVQGLYKRFKSLGIRPSEIG